MLVALLSLYVLYVSSFFELFVFWLWLLSVRFVSYGFWCACCLCCCCRHLCLCVMILGGCRCWFVFVLSKPWVLKLIFIVRCVYVCGMLLMIGSVCVMQIGVAGRGWPADGG